MKRHLRLAPVAVSAALVLAACGGGTDTATDDATGAAGAAVETATAEAMDDTASEEPMDGMASEDTVSEEPMDDMASDEAMAAGPVGPGCEQFATEIAPDGEGSVEGMSDDPVAVAASNNPILTTLTAAVSGGINPEVDLVDTLNGDEFTVFAPVDDAFAADVDEETLATLQEDSELLSSILTYHVVPGQVSPADIAGTTQTTVQGGTVEVAGEPDMLTVNGASVICGGVTTANATVYLIDGVLMPTS